MATDSENVLVALTGAIYTAPVATTAPTDADAAWGTGWVDLGYVSEDGLEEDYDEDATEIAAWQNGDIVRRMTTSSTATFGFTLLETTAAGLGLYYKGATLTGTGTGPVSMEVGAPTSERRAFGFDVIDGDRLKRMVCPLGEVTERGAITYRNNEAIAYEMTVTAYKGADGVSTYMYWSELAGLPA